MRGAAQKASPTEVVVPRTLAAPPVEVEEMVTYGPRLAIAAADLSAVVAERATGRIRWRSEAWIDRFGEVDTLAKHLPEAMELVELPLPPAGESWHRSRILQTADGDDVLFDLVLIGASTERGSHYVTVLATERIGSGLVVTDRPEVLDVLEEVLREAEGGSIATVYIDLDRFERVVNKVGTVHAVRLVEQVSRKISSTMRATDMLFRLQGDEFLIVAVGLADRGKGEEIGERVRSAIATLPEPADDLPLTASVGVAVNDPDQTAHNLLAAAETAVQLAKGRGRNQVVVSDEALPSRAERLLAVERQLRRAIEHRQVSFAYQPLVRLDDRSVIGAEALLRIGGDVGLSATDVVATAERSGLMGALGIIVVEGIEEQLGDWLVQPGTDRLAMMNVATSQLMDPEFVELLEVLGDHRELCGRFGIEVSAAAAMQNLDLIASLSARVTPDVRLGVDGWSDLNIPLKAVSDAGFSYVKLHQNLVTQLPADEDLRDRAERLLNESIERDIQVYAVGVKKETEVEALEQTGCKAAQGFLFSSAVASSELLRKAETSAAHRS
ncbi:MAG: EAL domain-containing protein [Acidimicrobiia bacterium]|nr:EAL domain-containing protein [Acidimicrobiia bacterium]